jgi:hypothetical protein
MLFSVFRTQNDTIPPLVTLWNPVYPGEHYWLGENFAVQTIADAVGWDGEKLDIIEI